MTSRSSTSPLTIQMMSAASTHSASIDIDKLARQFNSLKINSVADIEIVTELIKGLKISSSRRLSTGTRSDTTLLLKSEAEIKRKIESARLKSEAKRNAEIKRQLELEKEMNKKRARLMKALKNVLAPILKKTTRSKTARISL